MFAYYTPLLFSNPTPHSGLADDHWQKLQVKNLMDQKPATHARAIAEKGIGGYSNGFGFGVTCV